MIARLLLGTVALAVALPGRPATAQLGDAGGRRRAE